MVYKNVKGNRSFCWAYKKGRMVQLFVPFHNCHLPKGFSSASGMTKNEPQTSGEYVLVPIGSMGLVS